MSILAIGNENSTARKFYGQPSTAPPSTKSSIGDLDGLFKIVLEPDGSKTKLVGSSHAVPMARLTSWLISRLISSVR